MITVSAKALWWSAPEVCDCPSGWDELALDLACPHDSGGWQDILFTEINGWQYLTNRFVLLPTARLAELPVGYDQVLGLSPLSGQAADGLAEWLTGEVLLFPPDRLFYEGSIDPLEKAGFLIRALAGVKDAHAICDEDLTVVGLVSAVPRKQEGMYDRVRQVAR